MATSSFSPEEFSAMKANMRDQMTKLRAQYDLFEKALADGSVKKVRGGYWTESRDFSQFRAIATDLKTSSGRQGITFKVVERKKFERTAKGFD